MTILFTVGLVFIIFATFIFLIFGQVIWVNMNRLLKYPILAKSLWNTIRYLIMIIVMLFVFMFTYRYAPSKRQKWKEVLPGSMFTTIAWLVSSALFSYYVNNFSDYSKLYGSLAAVFILMAWLYISSIIILLGGEINAIIYLDLKKKREI
jgi:membrane protein